MSKNLRLKMPLLLLISFCAACESQELHEIKKVMQNIKKKVSLEKHASFSFFEPHYSYQANHLRSPFSPLPKEKEMSFVATSNMQTVGKIERNGEAWLLLQDEKGVVHVVLEK